MPLKRKAALVTDVIVHSIDEQEAADYRSRFPIFDHTVYLNSCSLGPLSVEAMTALDRYRDDWSRYGAPAWWQEWMGQLDRAKERFAQLIGAEPHEVTVSHSVSSALSSVASTFDYRQRPAVICAELDFPTIPYQWLAKRRQGIEVRVARSHDHIGVSVDAYLEHLDTDVALIATSHTFYTSGHIQPIRELASMAHEYGAKLIVDSYHSVGVHPVDVKQLGVDIYIGGTLKWLLGGPGLTFIYVREDLLADLEPSITGWFASADQFAFDAQHLTWPDTADRLELGTPAVASAYSGIAGMEMILKADPNRIYQRLQMLTEQIVRRAKQEGYEIVSPLDCRERGGIVMLRVREPRQTVESLSELGFTVDSRPGLVRVSPHFYNTLEDVNQFMDALESVQQRLG